MGYSIFLTRSAAKELLRIEKAARTRIGNAIDVLDTDPFTEAKKLRTPFPGYRLRIGDHRILFTVEKQLITVYSIKHRKDAYRK